MASIQKLRRKAGVVYRVEIRRKGQPTLSKTFRLKKHADAWAREIEGNLDAHKALLNPELRDNTLADLVDRYAMSWSGGDHSTLSRLAWWRDQYGSRPLAEVTRETIRDGLERLRTGTVQRYQQGIGVKATEKKRSPATLNRYCAAIGGAYRTAIKRGWFGLEDNPAHGIGREPEHNDRHGRRLKEDERERLLAACDQSTWNGLGLVVRMALGTGMRRGEIMGLRWQDVDLKEGSIRLIDTKNKDVRLVPLIPEILERLVAWAKIRRIDSDLVFPSPGNPKKPHNFNTAWRTAVKRSGIENFRFHDTRHSAASYLTDSGANHVLVAEILGHRTLAMVKRYSHGSTEAKRDALKTAMRNRLG